MKDALHDAASFTLALLTCAAWALLFACCLSAVQPDPCENTYDVAECHANLGD